jgi:alpha-glucoside transport system substrate-binding protein
MREELLMRHATPRRPLGTAAHRTGCMLAGGVALIGLALSSQAFAQNANFPPPLLDAARTAAKSIVDGKTIGGSVSVLGVDGGRELELLKATWKPFEEATGITVNYTGTTDFAAVLQTRVQAGDPPDIADSTNINNLVRYAKLGALQDVGAMVGKEKLQGMFNTGLIEAVTIDGKIYGVWDRIASFMVWYNVHTYDGPKDNPSWEQFDAWAKQRASSGKTPWCHADERGPSSGAVGGNWIQAYFLKKYGPEKTRQWANGDLKWTSPEVKDAFQAFGAVVTDKKMVAGGPLAVLSTPAIKIGTGLFSKPPQCDVLLWGTYAGGLTRLIYPDVKPVTDLDFMPIPASNPQFAKDEVFGGTLHLAFKNTPQAAAFLAYLASPEAQVLVAATGNWTVANQKVTPADYPDPITRKAREMLLGPDRTLVAVPSIVVAPPVIAAYWKGIVQYIRNPASLDEVLASIEATK